MEDLKKVIPANYALKHRIFPLRVENGTVYIASCEPLSDDLVNELKFIFNQNISFKQWPEKKLLENIYQQYQIQEEKNIEEQNDWKFEHLDKRQEKDSQSRSSEVEDRSIIHLVNQFISDAVRMKASDIHVESYENLFRIRFRIDGKLIEHEKPAINKRQPFVSRLKIMADMDIAEKRRPQDGRIRMKSGQKSIDIRVSTMPTDFGEKVVLRILDKSSLNLSLNALGIEQNILDDFHKVLKMPNGMVLVTGPTGSGKTTTLYAALNFLNQPDVNIITIEDPIEYNLPGINQTMVKADIGLTFAGILRTVLRQDPNIVMVGEIRDGETAEIAIRAALTGHLVLSTLHTNDAISTIVRLIDMGIEPFLVANSLRMAVAQRLVRKICDHCKSETHIDWHQFRQYKLSEEIKSHRFYTGKGCSRCNQTGFSGREAIIEHLMIDEAFAELIINRASLSKLKSLAKSKKLMNLRDAGLKKAIEGTTTFQEVIFETMSL